MPGSREYLWVSLFCGMFALVKENMYGGVIKLLDFLLFSSYSNHCLVLGMQVNADA